MQTQTAPPSPSPPVAAPAASTAFECPECAKALSARPTMTGEILDCDDCGAELEVVSLSPLRVELAPDVEEDWGE